MAQQGDPWVEVVAAAQARASVLGPPRTELEDWRYVDVRPLDAVLPGARTSPPAPYQPALQALPDLLRVVLRDGVLDRAASVLTGLDAVALGDLPAQERGTLIRHWRDALTREEDPSACWSLAGGLRGLRLQVPAGAHQACHLHLLATGGTSNARIVIALDAGAALDLVITSVDTMRSRSCIGIDLIVGASAQLRVDHLQYNGQGQGSQGPAPAPASGQTQGTGQLLTHAYARLARDAHLHWTTCLQGGELVRERVVCELAEPGSELRCNGLIVLSGQRQAHVVTRVRHSAGPSTSAQLIKTIADGSSVASFDGLVAISAGADGAAATQHHHNLLLANSARVDTRPQLDIAADDVQAAHGATVGRPDPNELFYLRSRGLSAEQALALLVRGFALQSLALLHHPGARALAQQVLIGTMPGGHG